MKKILINKRNIIVFIMFIISILFVLYLPHIVDFKTFSVEPAEGKTKQELIELRKDITNQNLRYTLNFSNYLSLKYRISIVFGIFLASIFLDFRDRLLKYNIGRNNKYERDIKKIKLVLSSISSIFSLIIMSILFIIGLVAKEYDEVLLFFDKSSILFNIIVGNKLLGVILTSIIVMIFEFLNTYLILTIIDSFNLIKGIFIIIFMFWFLRELFLITGLYALTNVIPSIGLTYLGSEYININNFLSSILIMILWITVFSFIKVKGNYEIK